MEQKILADYLGKNKATILKKWFNQLADDYPLETARVLKMEQDQFANPIGRTLYQGIEGIYEEILQEMNLERLTASIDNIVRIKAVQEFTPSQAISFIFQFKKIVKDELGSKLNGINKCDVNLFHHELAEFDVKIDFLAGLSFDIYTQCRENIYRLRINEIKRNQMITKNAIRRG